MYQVVHQTDSEKRKMYSKIPKSQIIDMLIESNKAIDRMSSPSAFIYCPDIGGQAAMDMKITTFPGAAIHKFKQDFKNG